MLIRLALRNVRHFSRDYLIYFLTLTIAVSLFYCFNASGSMSLLAGAEDLPDTVPASWTISLRSWESCPS